jgi:DNA-binding HxlR family transcriptional regulator
MTLKNYASQKCPIAEALRIVGDQWTILILRDALMGYSRFEEFQGRLGISRNLLARRLKQLVADGLLEKTAIAGSRRSAYRPTDKAGDLHFVLAALADWGGRWQGDAETTRLAYTTDDGATPVGLRFVRLPDGTAVDWSDVRVERSRPRRRRETGQSR